MILISFLLLLSSICWDMLSFLSGNIIIEKYLFCKNKLPDFISFLPKIKITEPFDFDRKHVMVWQHQIMEEK